MEATPATALYRSGHATAAYRTLLGAFSFDWQIVRNTSYCLQRSDDLWVMV